MLRHGEFVDLRQVELLRMLIDEAARAGVAVWPVVAPVPPAVIALLEQQPQNYRYLTEARRLLAERVPETLDLWDGRQLGGSNCEYYDSLHGDETVYARIALVMAQRFGAAWFDIPKLQEAVTLGNGFGVAAVDPLSRAFSAEIAAYQRTTACRPNEPVVRRGP